MKPRMELGPVLRGLVKEYLQETVMAKEAEYEKSSHNPDTNDDSLLSKTSKLYIDYTIYSKAIPKKPVKIEGIIRTVYCCPNCGKSYKASDINNYCDVCGQKFEY